MPNPAPEPAHPAPTPPSYEVLTRSRRAPEARETRANVGWIVLFLLLAVPGGLWASGAKVKQAFFPEVERKIETVEVDRGDVRSYVVEGGSLESADKATVRCQVEAVLGMVMSGGQGGQGGQMGQRGGNQQQQQQQVQQQQAQQQAAAKAGATGAAGAAAGKAAGAAQAVAQGQQAANAQAQQNMAGGQNAASAGGIIQKPVIKSFTMVVAPHTPLRPAAAAAAQAKAQQNLQQLMDPSQNGGNGDQQQKAGSTTILKILPEGTPVEAGDVVCWLDDAAFKDELKSQMIRYAQAKSWVEQAQYALKSAEIAREEYKNGVYPQDLLLVEQYTHTCQISLKQAQDNLAWEKSMLAKGLRTDMQAKGAQYSLQRAELALREAEGMRERLVKYTAPKLITNLEAKIAAVRADLEAQNAAFALEDQRKRKLERAIANCRMKAPRKGVVVYYVKSSGWGTVENEINEGVTVRENEPVFLVPDPSRMRVVVKVNESKVAYLHRGIPALIRVEAFPGQVLHGHVLEVTAIPTPAAGPFSDVKMYNASVEIEKGIDGLRTGMNARVEFLVSDREDVARVPVRALRWFDGTPYVATPVGKAGHAWRPVSLGMMNEFFAEVRSGLQPGERVVADPSDFAPPTAAEREKARLASRGQEPGLQG
jgi:multidrug resistance efflux pump